MYSTLETMEQRLVSAKMALTNALAEEEIKETLKELVFDEARLNQGMELYKRTELLYQVQRREYSEQYSASEELQKAWREARKVFKRYATVASLVLNDVPSLRNMLGLDQGRKYSLADWITLTRLFYTTALQRPDILEKLSEFTVTTERLQAGLQLVDKVEELHAKQAIEKAEAQQATKDRDASFAELDKYMYMFNKIARMMLVDKPQYLEKLGILERSVPLKKKKKEESEEEQTESPAPQGKE